MKYTIWMISGALALLALSASADTVYMTDGTVHHGRVTKQGSQYVVNPGSGSPVVVESADVDKIIPDSSEGPSAPPVAAASAPAPAASAPAGPGLFGAGVVAAPAAGGGVTATLTAAVRWSMESATLAEPIVFMVCRQIELAGQGASAGLGQSLGQYRSYAHEGRRKIGTIWENRADQTRMRAEFQKHVDLALRLIQSAGRGNTGNTGAYGAGAAAAILTPLDKESLRKRDLAEAFGELQTAAKVFPDVDIRDLLQGDLELSKSNWQPAEARFRRLTAQQPLVAAYHQGRALALIGLKQSMEALDEAYLTAQLRSDSMAAFQVLQKAIQAVPGNELQNPRYQAAKAFIDRYEMPKQPAKAALTAVEWLMPGKSWQSRDNTLPIPPYDCIVAKQALAVPIGDDRLLVDAKALADAEIIYVEISPGQYVRADQVKATAAAAGAADVPLAVLHVNDARFTPVVINPAALVPGKAGSAAQAVNLYRQMGNEIRTWQATLATDGLKLEKGTLPGEATGVVFAGDGVGNFVLGRTDVENPQCGESAIIQPAALQAFLAPLIKTGSHSSFGGSYSSNGPKLKATATPAPAKGKSFLVHILASVKPETPAAK